jgi:hypothetical protein
MSAVQFREPVHEVTEFTDIGTGIRHRSPARPPTPVRRPDVFQLLAAGPFLAGFDAGLYDLRDAAGKGLARVRLTTWVF